MTPSDSFRERVAKQIWDKDPVLRDEWERLTEQDRENYRHQADALLAQDGLGELIAKAFALIDAEDAFFDKPNDKRREEGPAMGAARNAALDASRAFARSASSG